MKKMHEMIAKLRETLARYAAAFEQEAVISPCRIGAAADMPVIA